MKDQFSKNTENKSPFRIAWELSPDGFVTFHPFFDENGNLIDFIFTFQNAAAAEMAGTDPVQIIGKKLLELFPGQRDTKFFKTYKEVYETGKPQEFEDHYEDETFKDDLWFRIVAIPAGEGIAVHAQNITERKQAERTTKENESRLLYAQKLARIGSFSYDLESGKIDWNEEMYKIYEVSHNEVPKMEMISSHLDPTDKKRVAEAMSKSVIDNSTINIETKLHFPDNRIKYISYIGTHVFNSSGKAVKRVGAVMDITDRKLQELKLEEALTKLQRSEARLLEAQKLARIGNYSIDFKNNGKMEWSDEMYNIWEVDKNAPFPTVEEVWKLVHPDDLEELNRVLTNKLPESERVETEFRIVFPGNRIKYVHIITKVTFDEYGNLCRREGIEMDITERKIAQMELEKTLNELERSNQELQQFAYVASHDLQEPLRMVSSYMSILEKKYYDQLDEKGREFIHFAVDGSKRMTNLIRDLLTYSRVTSQAKEFRETDLNEVYNDVTRDLQVLIKEKGAKITASKLPVLKTDPIQIHQLFQNLIGNAIKFHGERAPEVNLKAKAVRNGWLFSIKDNGIGIDPEYYEKIFQVFQRLHDRDKYPGTGIGLAVCKKIVERHGGRIWVESEIDKGTTFYFTIAEHNRSLQPEEGRNLKIMM